MVFEEMKNEPKYVMLWIDYADTVRTPGEVFTFMQVNKIGELGNLFFLFFAVRECMCVVASALHFLKE